MKLNFDFLIKDLSGEDFKDGKANEIVANLLAALLKGTNATSSIKCYDWAVKIFNKQEIEVDDTDFEILKTLIEESPSLPALTRAQLLKYMISKK